MSAAQSEAATFAVLIPAYNRPSPLLATLRGIAAQAGPAWRVLVRDDASPQRDAIRAAVEEVAREYPGVRIEYHRNETTLGYDGNLRELIRSTNENWLVLCADDDVLTSDYVQKVEAVCSRHPEIGMVLRAWQHFSADCERLEEEHQYYPKSGLLPPSAKLAAEVIRASVFVSGLILRGDAARELETRAVDGKLLYQCYLAGCMAARRPIYYLADIVALRVSGNAHSFGTAPVEASRFQPRDNGIEQGARFIRGLVEVGELVERETKLAIRERVQRELGRRSLGLLYLQASRQPRMVFLSYWRLLREVGLGRSLRFYLNGAICLALGSGGSRMLMAAVTRYQHVAAGKR